MNSPKDIEQELKKILQTHCPPLTVRVNKQDNFEVAGSIPVMQGKKPVEGHYFASLVPKPKDVRFYFFPIYTHPDQFDHISDELRKSLKGKSCFHIKRLPESLHSEWQKVIEQGVKLYQSEGII